VLITYGYIFIYSCLQLSPDFAFGLYELDYDIFGVHIAGAVNRVPCLEQVHRQIFKKIMYLGPREEYPQRIGIGDRSTSS
jgi:hypothetical protein